MKKKYHQIKQIHPQIEQGKPLKKVLYLVAGPLRGGGGGKGLAPKKRSFLTSLLQYLVKMVKNMALLVQKFCGECFFSILLRRS